MLSRVANGTPRVGMAMRAIGFLRSVLKSILKYLNARHDVENPPLNICIHVDSLLKG